MELPSYTDSTYKVSIINNHFSSVFTIKDTQSAPTLDESPYPDIQPITFNSIDVLQFLASLEVHKTRGPDKMPSYSLQPAFQEIAPMLALIFNS